MKIMMYTFRAHAFSSILISAHLVYSIMGAAYLGQVWHSHLSSSYCQAIMNKLRDPGMAFSSQLSSAHPIVKCSYI